MTTAPATTRLPNIKGWVYDDEDSYCRVEDEEAREMVTDAYDPAKTYKKGETRIQDNKLYRAKADIATAEIWTPDHWEETSLEQIRKEMAEELSALNAKPIQWELLAESSSATKQSIAVDTSPYRFILFMLCFYGTICSQMIVPVNMINEVRSLSTYVDGNTDALIAVLYQGSTSDLICITVLKDFQNATSGKVYGIK